jgi:hypothetical protein
VVSVLLLAAFLAGDEASAGAVKVEGGGGCPSPADVAARLEPLLPPGPAEAAPRRALMSRDGRDLRVELRDADGAVLAFRRLGAAACGDLAAAAAVVIATWEVELRGRGVVGLWPDAPPPPPPPPPPPVVRAPPPAPPAPALEVALGGAALVAAGASGGLAPGLLLELRGARPAGWLGGTVGLILEGDRSLPLEGGFVTWRRAVLLAGAFARRPIRSGVVGLEADAGAMAAVLSLRGVGFTQDDTLAVMDAGATASGRLTLRILSLRPWVGAGVRVWPIAREAAVAGPSGASAPGRNLPRGEVFVALGLALGVRP